MVGRQAEQQATIKQLSDNDDFRRWLTETVFALTYKVAS